MRVMVAGASEERQFLKSYRSFCDMKIRDGDILAEPSEFTRGDVTRMSLCDEFMEHKEYDAILLLDLDMVHPTNLLERLRSHDVDMVTAHYWKRKTPMESIIGIGDKWPYLPLKEPFPTEGLMEVSTTGFGAVLIKREVIGRVSEHVYPEHPLTIGPEPEMSPGNGGMGSDMRLFFYAKELGYKLWLDCSQESLHAVNVWLSRSLYKRWQEPDWEAEEERKILELQKQVHG